MMLLPWAHLFENRTKKSYLFIEIYWSTIFSLEQSSKVEITKKELHLSWIVDIPFDVHRLLAFVEEK